MQYPVTASLSYVLVLGPQYWDLNGPLFLYAHSVMLYLM